MSWRGFNTSSDLLPLGRGIYFGGLCSNCNVQQNGQAVADAGAVLHLNFTDGSAGATAGIVATKEHFREDTSAISFCASRLGEAEDGMDRLLVMLQATTQANDKSISTITVTSSPVRVEPFIMDHGDFCPDNESGITWNLVRMPLPLFQSLTSQFDTFYDRKERPLWDSILFANDDEPGEYAVDGVTVQTEDAYALPSTFLEGSFVPVGEMKARVPTHHHLCIVLLLFLMMGGHLPPCCRYPAMDFQRRILQKRRGTLPSLCSKMRELSRSEII